MHLDKFPINTKLVRRLLADQFPEWSEQALEKIKSKGTDNVMYRLSNDKVVRLPLTKKSAAHIEKEHLWVPKLVPHLPIKIPTLLGSGKQNLKYPFNWLIYNWLEGETPGKNNCLNLNQAAMNLGNFVVAMQKIDATNGPKCKRGQPIKNTMQKLSNQLNYLKIFMTLIC